MLALPDGWSPLAVGETPPQGIGPQGTSAPKLAHPAAIAGGSETAAACWVQKDSLACHCQIDIGPMKRRLAAS
ncbi:hypothetical protein [Cyanobium sp. ULC065]